MLPEPNLHPSSRKQQLSQSPSQSFRGIIFTALITKVTNEVNFCTPSSKVAIQLESSTRSRALPSTRSSTRGHLFFRRGQHQEDLSLHWSRATPEARAHTHTPFRSRGADGTKRWVPTPFTNDSGRMRRKSDFKGKSPHSDAPQEQLQTKVPSQRNAMRGKSNFK